MQILQRAFYSSYHCRMMVRFGKLRVLGSFLAILCIPQDLFSDSFYIKSKNVIIPFIMMDQFKQLVLSLRGFHHWYGGASLEYVLHFGLVFCLYILMSAQAQSQVSKYFLMLSLIFHQLCYTALSSCLYNTHANITLGFQMNCACLFT